MNTINLHFLSVTTEKSGYGEPIVEVQADKEITVVNRGYNHFQATEEINLWNIDINEFCLFSKEHGMWDTYKCLLRIKMPSGKVKHAGYQYQHQIGNGYNNIKKSLNW